MEAVVGPVLVGVLLLVIGRANWKGNIASVHWYHRRRVREEDRLPFGRAMGLGTGIIGASLVAFGGLSLAAWKLGEELLTEIGSALVIACVAAGLGLMLYAMVKYNRGIF